MWRLRQFGHRSVVLAFAASSCRGLAKDHRDVDWAVRRTGAASLARANIEH